MFPVCSLITLFWVRYPALLLGLSAFLGVSFSFERSSLAIIPALFLWCPFLAVVQHPLRCVIAKRLWLSGSMCGVACLYALLSRPMPSLPEEGIAGHLHLTIRSVSLQQSHFGMRWLYHCEVRRFFPENRAFSSLRSLSCLLTLPALPDTNPPYPADRDYLVSGTLKEVSPGRYHCKVKRKSPWHGIEGSHSWTQWRYECKRYLSAWIARCFPHPHSATFVAGLITGSFDDRAMKEQFSRFGLLHLLAISGFHFSLIATCLRGVLQWSAPSILRLPLLFLSLSAYAFFLGPQPSILRAWIMYLYAIGGEICNRRASPINGLGIALLLIIAYDPSLVHTLAFQLSAGTTAALLLLVSPAQWLIDWLLPKRPLHEVLQMRVTDQIAYCLLSFFRKGISLSLAVNGIAFPLTLYFFHSFPLMGIWYNLFFPLFTAGTICLFLCGLATSFIPFVASSIHQFNSFYTHLLLKLTSLPDTLDSHLVIESMHPIWIIGSLCTVLLGGIYWNEWQLHQRPHTDPIFP